MTVLDASALLALIHEEPGVDLVAEAMTGSVIGTPNLAEMIGRLVAAQIDASACGRRRCHHRTIDRR